MQRRRFLHRAAATGLALGVPAALPGLEPLARAVSRPSLNLSLAAYSYRQLLSGPAPAMDMHGFLETCAGLGLSACEPTSYYFPPEAGRDYFLDFRRRAFLLGLDISGTAIRNTFTLPPGPEREQQLSWTRQWVDHAAIIGAPCIRIFAGDQPKDASLAQALGWCVDCLRLACDYAATRGIFLALENHGGVVAEAGPMLEIVRQVESPWFGVNLDTGNFRTADPYADLARLAPYAVNVQVKHEMRPAGRPAEPADFPRLARLLAQAGYRGYVVLEYEGPGDPREEVPHWLERLRAALASIPA